MVCEGCHYQRSQTRTFLKAGGGLTDVMSKRGKPLKNKNMAQYMNIIFHHLTVNAHMQKHK